MSSRPVDDSASKRRRDATLVPLRSLYGETSGSVVDFIHIEPLRDRSELFDWSIDAHTHGGLHQVVLLFEGRVWVTLDESVHDMRAPAAIAIPAAMVHSFEYEPHSEGFMLTVADAQMDGSGIGEWLRTRLFEGGSSFSLAGNHALVERLRFLSSEIETEQRTVDNARVATIDWLTRTVFVLLARESERVNQHRPEYRASDLFRDFRSAVEAHYAEHWSVGEYADRLHVSESSLNRLCRAVTGNTAFEIVQDRLELEARRRLIYSDAPVHRIAMDLGFVDPSYFARFFKRRTGLSPRTFRTENHPILSSHQQD